MEKNGMPKYDVWAYGMPSECDLKVAQRNGALQKVQLMRRVREQGSDSLVYRVTAELRVLSVQDRRRGNATKKMVGSMHRELAVEVEVAENVPMGILNGLDDGLGLSAFKAGTQFTLVYCPDDRTQTARVSRSCDVLYVSKDESGANEVDA